MTCRYTISLWRRRTSELAQECDCKFPPPGLLTDQLLFLSQKKKKGPVLTNSEVALWVELFSGRCVRIHMARTHTQLLSSSARVRQALFHRVLEMWSRDQPTGAKSRTPVFGMPDVSCLFVQTEDNTTHIHTHTPSLQR